MITAATAISAIPMLRDQAIEPELASFAKQVRPDLALLEFRDKDTTCAFRSRAMTVIGRYRP
jgi:hypothetical protein